MEGCEIVISSKFTEEMQMEVRKLVDETIIFFPEASKLGSLTINRLNDDSPYLGMAYFSTGSIALKWKPCHHTIAHELVHILRGRYLINIPASEYATDVFGTARAKLFNGKCPYVDYSPEIYEADPEQHFAFMLRGVDYFAKFGKYKWCRLLKKDMKEFAEKACAITIPF